MFEKESLENVKNCIEKFLNTKKVMVYDKKYGWCDEEVNRTQENMTVFTFNNGNGVVVIDTEKFNGLSKTKQNKILKKFKED